MGKVLLGDCREVMRSLADNSVDAIVCDPPYELGFMGKKWDSTGVAYDPETWREALRVLKPGGHLLAFGGTRTYHRMVVAIEDAGFEIRDAIMWLYGQGMPKGLDVSGAIDNADDAKVWDGWGTGLKPAVEPIVVARKPIEESTIAQNVLKYGTGAINVDACKIGTEGGYTNHTTKVGKEPGWHGKQTGEVTQNGGRHPANVILDEEAAQMLDAHSGVLTSGENIKSYQRKHTGPTVAFGATSATRIPGRPFASNSGGASRFFYIAKASTAERGPNIHPTVKPITLMRYLVKLVTPPGGVVLDPFGGSGTTGVAATMDGFDFVLIEREQIYVGLINKRIAAVPPSLFDND